MRSNLGRGFPSKSGRTRRPFYATLRSTPRHRNLGLHSKSNAFTNMSATTATPVRKLWWRWKSLRLPWRKKWLVGIKINSQSQFASTHRETGADLSGNTFWEFKDQIAIGRMRRIVEYANANVHYADVKVSRQYTDNSGTGHTT